MVQEIQLFYNIDQLLFRIHIDCNEMKFTLEIRINFEIVFSRAESAPEKLKSPGLGLKNLDSVEVV
jgi:hypothetical protein